MKKGFTLIELLAVIIILAIIALIAIPTITNIVEKAGRSSFEDSAYGVIKAGELYYADQMLTAEGMSENKTFDFEGNIEGLEIKGSKPTSGTMTINTEGKIVLKVTNGKYCAKKEYNEEEITITSMEECFTTGSNVYVEAILNGADPVLKEGMVPVKIEATTGKVIVADITEEWYKYSEQKWANMVLVKNTASERNKYINEDGSYKTTTDNAPTEVIEEDILAYFVWIPRYKYKLWYIEATDGTTSQDTTKVHTIDIVFEDKDTAKSDGKCSGTTISNDCYLTHPAFTFGEISEGVPNEVNGIWVGKFETGYEGATTKAEAQISTANTNKVIIKPNVYSWRNINVNNAFSTVRGMNGENNIFGLTIASDTHMMKNTEWGAAAYLSHSLYGKGSMVNGEYTNSEVYINNNSDYKTGCGGNTTGASSDPNCTNSYKSKNDGIYNQSTTGNITGIFDMSGGAWEYVMGYTTAGALTNSGFESLPDDKYIDKYSSSASTAYSKRILGDATGEMRPYVSGNNKGSWYDDYASFVNSGGPWFRRGGDYGSGAGAGAFSFYDVYGPAYSDISFRVVVLDK